MMKQRFLTIERLTTVLLCSLVVVAAGRAAPRQVAAPKGWPQRVGERQIHTCEYGFIYAGKKSSVEQLHKVLATVAKDAKQDGVTTPGAGLILVVDAKENYPCEIAKLVAELKKVDPNTTADKSAKGLKAIADGEKEAADLGLDPSVMLSLVPIPIQPQAVHKVAEGFPADVETQVQWCVICPTDRCLKANFKRMLEAALKKEKPGLAERVAIATLRPLVERKAMAMMRKGRQAGLYTLFLDRQKGLSLEQKRQKVEAYREKLGLNEQFDPEKDQNTPSEPETDETDSE